MNQAESLLRDHSLRLTGSRAEILSIFFQEGRAMSQREIESVMEKSCDRVTIYRTLSTFMDNGLLHKVLDNSGVTKFALCSLDCEEKHEHQHDHVHFKCTNCGKTLCVDEVRLPEFQLPEGYASSEIYVLIQGTCANCNA